MTDTKRENNYIHEIEWLSKEPIPHFRHNGKEYFLLNDRLEILIDGVLYRVHSIYSNQTDMSALLDSLMLEQINRKTA